MKKKEIMIPEGYEDYWKDDIDLGTLFMRVYYRITDDNIIKKFKGLDVMELINLIEEYHYNDKNIFTFRNEFLKQKITDTIEHFKKEMINLMDDIYDQKDREEIVIPSMG